MLKWCVVFFLVGEAFTQTTPQLISPKNQEIVTSALGNPESDVTTEGCAITRLPEVDTERDLTTNITPTTTHFNIDIYPKSSSATTTNSTETPPVKKGKQIQKNNEYLEEIRNSALIQATKELQEHHSRPDDPKEDFLNFVQTAIRSTSKLNHTNNVPRAPVLIKQLIDIKPRLKNRPTLRKPSTELPSRKEISKIDNGYNDFVSQVKKNNNYNHLNLDAQSDLNKNIHQVQKASLQPRISSRNKVSFLPNHIRPLQNITGALNRHLNTEEYNNGEQFPHGTRGFEPEVSFTPTADFSALQQTKTPPNQMRLYNKYNSQENQRNPEDIQPKYYTFLLPKSSPPKYQIPLQRRVLPSTPIRKIPEEEYGQVEYRKQAGSAKYSFESDIEDNINGNLQQRQESREGSKVTGSYTYEDGFFRRTVHYVADEKGYRVVKEKVDEIGDGPLYNPDGSARIHAYIAGNNVNYQITNKDISKVPQIKYQQPDYQGGHEWRY